MKYPSAYYLLLLYTISICKPLLPLVSDVLAHTFWQTNHISAVHQHQGKNHLHDELGEAAKQDTTDANTTGGKSSESVPVHLLTQYHFDFLRTAPAVQKLFNGSSTIISAFLEKHTPPPKA